jgi:hypothetical protein
MARLAASANASAVRTLLLIPKGLSVILVTRSR